AAPSAPYGRQTDAAPIKKLDGRFPVFISGSDARAVKEYATKLAAHVKRQPKAALADISFNINRQSNPDLSQRLLLRCRSVDELGERLESVSDHDMTDTRAERPVVLCFGGQIATCVGLD